MQLIICVCGRTYRRRIAGRCPHCHILTKLPGDSRPSTFEGFATLELERGRVTTVLPSWDGEPRQAHLYFYDPSHVGPGRYGWRSWPNNLTEEQIVHLLAMQAGHDNSLDAEADRADH